MKIALAAAAAVLIALVAVLVLPGGTTREPAPPALAVGAPAGAAVRIGRDPVGLSIEYQLLAHDLGPAPCPPPALVAAIAALGEPTLRIGGDSQDETAPAGTPAQPGVSDLPPGFWSRLRCLERETRVPVVVGLNVASDQPAWAATLAADARSAVPAARLSFELGNEPDIYGVHVPWWNGRALVHAPMPFATYLRRARAVEAELPPGSTVEGPDFASGRWISTVPLLVRTLHLGRLDAHFYPLDACRRTAGATTAALLSRGVQEKLDERVHLARDARAAGLEAVISETNSISCGGVRGVSDSPAAAVWGVRLVLGALRDGFASVRFHSSGGAYDPFVVRGRTVVLRPLYAGMRALVGLLPRGATLRAIPGAAAALDAVAIAAPRGRSRTIVLSNYSPAPLAVSVAARGTARVLSVIARAPTVVRSAVTAAPGGRARVELPGDSVVAITSAQPGAST